MHALVSTSTMLPLYLNLFIEQQIFVPERQ